jgi:hypothetical protein
LTENEKELKNPLKMDFKIALQERKREFSLCPSLL